MYWTSSHLHRLLIVSERVAIRIQTSRVARASRLGAKTVVQSVTVSPTKGPFDVINNEVFFLETSSPFHYPRFLVTDNRVIAYSTGKRGKLNWPPTFRG